MYSDFSNVYKSHGTTSHCTPMSDEIPHIACTIYRKLMQLFIMIKGSLTPN